MMQGRSKRIAGSRLGCLVVLALVVGGFGIQAEGESTKETKVALPAEQVIASITTALATQPGKVQAVEAEHEKGKTICEVEILADNGKTYDVEVDVATNTVVEVKVDDDDEDADEDEDDKDEDD